jgi:hypothetical protein
MFALPDQKGFFEIRTEGGVPKARGSRAQAASNSLVVYFYQPDGTTELRPAPTDVTVKVGTGSGSPVVLLTPQARTGFASPPGHFPSGFRGQLNARINGETVESTFVVR